MKNLKILKIPFDKTKFYDILSFYIRNGAGDGAVVKADKKLKYFKFSLDKAAKKWYFIRPSLEKSDS